MTGASTTDAWLTSHERLSRGAIGSLSFASVTASTYAVAAAIALGGALDLAVGLLLQAAVLFVGVGIAGALREGQRGVQGGRGALGLAATLVGITSAVAIITTDGARWLAFVAVAALGIALSAIGPLLIPTQVRRSPWPIAPPVAATIFLGGTSGALFSGALGYLDVAAVSLWGAFIAAGAAAAIFVRVSLAAPVRLAVNRAPQVTPHPKQLLREWMRPARPALRAARRSPLIGRVALAGGMGAMVVVPSDVWLGSVLTGYGAQNEMQALLGSAEAAASVLAAILYFALYPRVKAILGVSGAMVVGPLIVGGVLLGSRLISSGPSGAAVWFTRQAAHLGLDHPARRRAEAIFPADAHPLVDWWLHRFIGPLGLLLGALGSLAILQIFGIGALPMLATAVIALWFLAALHVRGGFARSVMTTSLINHADFADTRAEDLHDLLDETALRDLEREIAGRVPARVQLATELLRDVAWPRLPVLIAANYLRQAPALRPIFLEALVRVVPRLSGAPLRSAVQAIRRLMRNRLSDVERATLLHVWAEAARRGGLAEREVEDMLATEETHGSGPIGLAVAIARHIRSDRPMALDENLLAMFADGVHGRDEAFAHFAIVELERVVRHSPRRDRAAVDVLLSEVTNERLPVRVRAHLIGSIGHLREELTSQQVDSIGAWAVGLARHHDPRLAAAALELLADPRFFFALRTAVLPALRAPNHNVRARAEEAILAFGRRAIPALIDAVRSGTRRERVAVAGLLANYPVPRDTYRGLIDLEVDGLRRKVISAALLEARMGNASFDLLRARIDEEIGEHVRTAMRLMYAEVPDPVLVRVERQLWSRDAGLRHVARETLDQMGHRLPTLRAIARLVQEVPLANRARTARTAMNDAPESIDDVLAWAVSDGHYVTRLIAARTLREMTGGADRTLVQRLLVDPHEAVRGEMGAAEGVKGATAMTIVDRMLLMKSTQVFESFDARDLAGVAEVLAERRYACDEILMREGERGDHLAIVADGTVRITKSDGHGGQVPIRDLGRGAVIGEIALLEEGPRSATVAAASDCLVLTLTRLEFEDLIEEYPGVALGLCRVLSHRLQTVTAQAAARN